MEGGTVLSFDGFCDTETLPESITNTLDEYVLCVHVPPVLVKHSPIAPILLLYYTLCLRLMLRWVHKFSVVVVGVVHYVGQLLFGNVVSTNTHLRAYICLESLTYIR